MNKKRLDDLLNCDRGHRRLILVEGRFVRNKMQVTGIGGADKGDCREGFGAGRSKDRFKTRPAALAMLTSQCREGGSERNKGRCKRRQ